MISINPLLERATNSTPMGYRRDNLNAHWAYTMTYGGQPMGKTRFYYPFQTSLVHRPRMNGSVLVGTSSDCANLQYFTSKPLLIEQSIGTASFADLKLEF